MSKFTEYLETVGKKETKGFTSYKQMVSDIKKVLNKKYKVSDWDSVNQNLTITPAFNKSTDYTSIDYMKNPYYIYKHFNIMNLKNKMQQLRPHLDSEKVGHQIGKITSFDTFQELLNYLKTVK